MQVNIRQSAFAEAKSPKRCVLPSMPGSEKSGVAEPIGNTLGMSWAKTVVAAIRHAAMHGDMVCMTLIPRNFRVPCKKSLTDRKALFA